MLFDLIDLLALFGVYAGIIFCLESHCGVMVVSSQVAWNWLWENIERMLKATAAMPKGCDGAFRLRRLLVIS